MAGLLLPREAQKSCHTLHRPGLRSLTTHVTAVLHKPPRIGWLMVALAESLWVLPKILASRKPRGHIRGRPRWKSSSRVVRSTKGAHLAAADLVPPTFISADAALERTLGSGRYQLGITAGVGACIYSAAVAFSLLPLFLDLKLADDPRLPGLTADNLPLASTALFSGWLVGSLFVGFIQNKFGKKTVVRGGALGLLLCTVAGAIFPHMTQGSIFVLAIIRFATGVFLASTAVAVSLVQDFVPPQGRNRFMVALNVCYSLFAIALTCSCGAVMRNIDWRLELLFWCGAPMVIGLLFGLPRIGESLSDLAATGRQQEAASLLAHIAHVNGEPLSAQGIAVAAADGAERNPNGLRAGHRSSPVWTAPMMKRVGALSVCFLACGFGFYGLSYSAGQLSTNIYTSSALLSATDIVGYAAALSADSFGLRALQSTCFGVAACCLLLCSIVAAGGWQVLACALVGRLCLDICFTTIFVSVVNSFPTACRSGSLMVCMVAARLGGVFAPYCGTLPASVSCALFSMLCLAAAGLTHAVPEKAESNLQVTPNVKEVAFA